MTVHMFSALLAMQFEAAGTPPRPAFSIAASGQDKAPAAADSSQFSPTVQMPAASGSAPATAPHQPTQPLQQFSLVSHPVDLEQHGDSDGKESYLFSNPTFESYLDPVSDDELQPVEGCTTPRSAIKQQVSQIGMRADHSRWTGELQTCQATPERAQTLQMQEACAPCDTLAAAPPGGWHDKGGLKGCCADLWIPMACEGAALHPEPSVWRQLSFACCSAKAWSLKAAHAGHMAASGNHPLFRIPRASRSGASGIPYISVDPATMLTQS